MNCTECARTSQSLLELATDPSVRQLRLSSVCLARGWRSDAFVLAACDSWCSSRRGRTFNPTIGQLAARSGLTRRTVQLSLKRLCRLTVEGELLLHRTIQGRRTSTTLNAGLPGWLKRTGYLAIPVALAQLCGEWGLSLLARCTLAGVTNRISLAERLIERQVGTVQVTDSLSLSALGKKVGARPYRIAAAINELAEAGLDLGCDEWGEVDLDPYQTWKYRVNHDTRIDWRSWQ